MTDLGRTPVVMVTGWGRPGHEGDGVAQTARALLRPGTVVVRHDLRAVGEGVVRRGVTEVVDGDPREQLGILELAHGCVSCTLREDLLPLLRRLHPRPDVARVVIELDPSLEPEALCWALHHVVVAGPAGSPDAPAGHDLRVEAVVTALDAATWLDDATSEDDLADRGWATAPDDRRTVAQLVVGQVEMADALVVTGDAGRPWEHARLEAVLDRLAPGAPRARTASTELALLGLAPHARRGAVDDAFSPLLRGAPALGAEAGVSLVDFTARRPFHPERLHRAVDTLLEGVVRTRGRVWLATQPEVALWLESAGGGLQIGAAGRWLATLDADDPAWGDVDPQRRAMAALRWDPEHGDRDTAISVLVHAADPEEVRAALQGALLTDAEMVEGPAVWITWTDPFAEFHTDPCQDTVTAVATTARRQGDQP